MKPQLRVKPNSFSLTALITISLLALFSPPHEAFANYQFGIDKMDARARVIATPGASKEAQGASQPASLADSEANKKDQKAIQSSGIDNDTETILSAAKTVADVAQHIIKVIKENVETISFSDAIVIVGAAEAAFLVYLLIPPRWSAISFNLRGYRGELSPAQTLDLLLSTNHYLIDIRSEKDKDKDGIPGLPSSSKQKMIAIPLEELPSKLRGIIKNTKKVEAEIAALKISYLTKINKGSNIAIMDSNSDSAKIVARTLTCLGFKNCYIVADGFSGGKGWLQSRLGTDSYSSFAEILSPSRIIPAGTSRFGTTGTELLPAAD